MIPLALLLLAFALSAGWTVHQWRGRGGKARAKRHAGQRVYVMAYGSSVDTATAPVKIGIGGKPSRRRREVQTGNPNRIVLYKIWQVPNARAVERAAHKLLADYRMEGEWFGVSPEDAVTAVQVVIGQPRPGIVPWFRRWRLKLGQNRDR